MNKSLIVFALTFSCTPCIGSDTSGLIPLLALVVGVPCLILSTILCYLLYKKLKEKVIWLLLPVIFSLLCYIVIKLILFNMLS